MRALVVDDAKAARIFVGRMMRELGFEMVDAAHGREALEKLVANAPT